LCVPARAADYIGAYLEEGVSPGALKVQRTFFWVLCALALGFVVFGVLDWAKSPSEDAWPFDTAMIVGGALFIAAVFWVRWQTLRVWRRAGLL
jgi:hypothetical protein